MLEGYKAKNIKTYKINNSFDPKAPANINFNKSKKAIIKDISFYTPDDKTYFGSDTNAEIVDPAIGLATFGMGGLSLTEGVGTYLGNNFIALAGLLNFEDEAMGVIDDLGSSWGTLFEDDGIFGELNEVSLMKYNDESWQNVSNIGHAASVGTGRYLCNMIPYVGPIVSNVVTFGDGYGSAYRHARESGSDQATSGILGLSNGAIQTLSFGFSNVLGNIAIGTAMPFAETTIQTIGETNTDGSFMERYSVNFENNGGITAVGISALMYGLNARAGQKIKTLESSTSTVLTDTDEAVKEMQKLGTPVDRAFDTPFITTALNTTLNTIINLIFTGYLPSSVPSTRPI